MTGGSIYKKNSSGEITINVLNATYSYPNFSHIKTGTQPCAVTMFANNGYSKMLSYQYDKVGNIINDSGKTYVYNDAGELTRVNDPIDNHTYVYSYDVGGNISSKTTYDYTLPDVTPSRNPTTVSYGYDSTWKDELTCYNSSTQNIFYDAIGNPTTYNNGSDHDYTFTWEMGRQLTGVSHDNKTIKYNYNQDGIRQSKEVTQNSIKTTTKYTLVDSKITGQDDGTNSLYFRYDSNDSLIGFEKTTGSTTDDYYYVKNPQGDVLSILDGNGNDVVDYTYDAWGKLLSTTDTSNQNIGSLNPFRYRSYYFDTETGLYYLQSRYYDANTGRFINADDTSILQDTRGEVLGANLFAYCNNNPINNYDPSGNLFVFAGNDYKFNVNDKHLIIYFLRYMTKLSSEQRNQYYNEVINCISNFGYRRDFDSKSSMLNWYSHHSPSFAYTEYALTARLIFAEAGCWCGDVGQTMNEQLAMWKVIINRLFYVNKKYNSRPFKGKCLYDIVTSSAFCGLTNDNALKPSRNMNRWYKAVVLASIAKINNNYIKVPKGITTQTYWHGESDWEYNYSTTNYKMLNG